ncbi:MAG: c-type cytochrome, partial [Nitrospinota bacterium]
MRISIVFAVCLFLAASLATGGALLGVTKGDLEEGRKLYLAFCSSCHGSRGKGDGWAAKFLSTPPRDHTDQSYMGHKTDQDLYEFISAGERAFHGSKYMPRWSMKLEPKQIWDLIAYMRTLYRAPQGDPIEGRKLYLTFCTSCHGRSGRGDGPMTKYLDAKPMDHTDDGVMSTKTDRDLYSALSGSEGPFHGSK